MVGTPRPTQDEIGRITYGHQQGFPGQGAGLEQRMADAEHREGNGQLLQTGRVFAVDQIAGQHHAQRQQEVAQRDLQRPAVERCPHEQP